jgi:DNA polymerase III delta prime subunit
LTDRERIKRQFSREITGNFIFSGISGIGKFGLALEIAKNHARDCDIISFSKCGIDQIRSVIKFVNLKPFASKYRLAIINIDGITTVAAQALLKVLEETPPKSRFLLTGNIDLGIPSTILSRCKKINIKPLTILELLELPQIKHMTTKPSFSLLSYAGGSAKKLMNLLESKQYLDKVMQYIHCIDSSRIENVAGLVKGWTGTEIQYLRILGENVVMMDINSSLLYTNEDLQVAKRVLFDIDSFLRWVSLNMKPSLKATYIAIRCFERR